MRSSKIGHKSSSVSSSSIFVNKNLFNMAYTIVPIFKHFDWLCASVFHQWLHEYCPFKRQFLWPVGVTVIFDGTPQIIVQITAPRWPNDVSSAADNAILKNRAQNMECSFGCVARSADLLKPNIANILLFNLCEKKFVQHGPITIVIDCNGLFLINFRKKKCPNYAFGPKSAPNSDSFWVRRLFNVCLRVFYAPNATSLLVCIPAKIKIGFIWKDNFFFFAKIGIFCKSIANPLSEAKSHWMDNWLQLLNQLTFV